MNIYKNIRIGSSFFEKINLPVKVFKTVIFISSRASSASFTELKKDPAANAGKRVKLTVNRPELMEQFASELNIELETLENTLVNLLIEIIEIAHALAGFGEAHDIGLKHITAGIFAACLLI